MSKPNLVRTLGLRDLTLLTIGAVIGSGIFTVSGEVLRQVGGSMTLALLAWVIGGLLSLLGALTYAELTATNPAPGGLYIHIRDCFGKLPAFLYGWAVLLAIISGANAALAVAFSNYLGELVTLSPVAAKAISIAMLMVTATVNIRGARHSANLQNWSTGIKVGSLIVLSAALLLFGNAPAESATAFPSGNSLVTGFGLAMIGVLWAYEGWQICTSSAGEAVDPQRNFPRAYALGMALLIAVYLFANLGYLKALGPEQSAATDRIAATAVAAVFGPTAAKLVAIAIMISVFSAANSSDLTAPRVYYAMANDRLFFRKLSEIHPRYGTPVFAILTGMAWSSILVLTGTFEQLLTYVVFTGWIFYGLAAASIFVYRKRSSAPRDYSVPFYPWTPILFILAAMALVVNTVVAAPWNAAFGLGIVLTGMPAYLVWKWWGRREMPDARA